MKKFFCGIAVIALTALLGACGDKTALYVYSPVDYVDDEVVKAFEKETGVKVKYDTFDTNEAMYTNVKNDSRTRYDVVMPSDYMIERMIAEDMLEKIDLSNIPNLSNIDARFLKPSYDPNGEYSVSFMWGTVGILYSAERVPAEEVTTWGVLWSDKYRKRIFMMDSVRDSIGITLKYLGFSLNSLNPDELGAAKAKLIEQKPLTLAYVMDTAKDKMAAGEADLAIVYSGDAIYAFEYNSDLRYAVPDEGSNLWLDGIAVLKGAKHKAEAELFINYLCKAEVAAERSVSAGYTTVNRAALEYLPDELKNSEVFWPDEKTLDRCEQFVDLGDFKREYDKAWNDILTTGN